MSFVRTMVLGALVAAVAAGSALAAPAASAAPAPRSTAGLHAKLPAGKLATVPTTNYGAGYFAYPGDSNGASGASVNFTMPAFSCVHASDSEWLLPGIWVYDNNGDLSQQVDVNFNCNQGTKLQEGVICIANSCDTSLVVSPGDVISASIAYTSTATIGTLRNRTTGLAAQVVGAAVTTDITIFTGDEGPSLFIGGAVTKVPSFTTVPFSAATVNGQSLSDWSAAHYNLKTGTSLQITAGPLSVYGTKFTTKFNHS